MLQFYCRPQAFHVPVGQLTIVTAANLPPATEGQFYTASLSAIGGVPPYVWALLAVTGPDLWSISTVNSVGIINGTPGLSNRITNTGALRITNSGALRVT